MNPIRIIIVDDESVVREGVEAILSYQQDIQVVGKGADGITAVELARDTKPDVVLLDMVMPKMSGLQAIPLIKKESPVSRILILSSFAESDQVYQSIKAGALGYLLKDSTREQLVAAIRDVAEDKASLHPAIAMKVIHEIDNPTELVYTADPLTPREMETLKLIARGLSNQEIAKAMVVHDRTVAKYVSSILDKLQLANRTQVALYAIREGLAEDEPTKPRK